MKMIRKLTNWMLTSAVIRAVYWTCCYIKDWSSVNEALHGNAFHSLLKNYLKMDSRIDWLGRVYGVVNPAINEKGEFDYNGMVFELDGINTNTETWVENWLYKQMILVNNVFDVQKTGFFDIIDAQVKHVGPENADNYLVIFDIASRKEMCRRWKRVIVQSIFYMIITGLIMMIF